MAFQSTSLPIAPLRTGPPAAAATAFFLWLALAAAFLLPPPAALAQSSTARAEARWLVVTGSLVRVRAEPNLTGTPVAAFASGTRLEQLLENNGWMLIRHPATGQTGWMSAEFLSSIPQPREVRRKPPRRTAALASETPRPAKPRPATTRPNAALSRRTPPPARFTRTQRLAVYGDSLATNLFHGLQNYAPRAGFYRVSRRTRGATGLIRDDQYDWYVKTIEYLKADRPDILVVTFGGNDRQDISGARRMRRFSDPWWQEYRRRVDRYMAALKRHVRRVYWLGLPVVRSTRMTSDYAKFNRIYRQLAARHGITYVDTWPRFQRPGGGYTARGPDIDGKPATLRNDDGIHFNRTGSLVLAQLVARAITGGSTRKATR